MVTLQVESATGVKETAGGMNVAFKLGSTKGATGIFSSVTDHLNGVYTATFTGEIEGSNTIVATIDGVKVALAPAIKVTPGQYSLSQSVVMAPTNAIAGVPITVTLQAKDAAGNKLTTGGLQVAFSLSGPGTLGAVKDNRNGTYTATFTGTKAGSTAITATIGNVPVTSTAPIIHVAPGPGSPAKSLVSLTSSSLQAGGSITFTLQAVDAQGNPDVSGGLKVAFALANHTGGQGTFSAVTDHKNGTYTATFTGTFAGVNNIVATIGGVKVVTGSPAVTVSPGVVNLAKSTVSLSQASVELGGAITVTLTARDAYGNVETAGGLTVSFMLGGSGDSSMFSSVVDHGNGTYTATFTAGTAGTNTIVAEIGGKPPTSAPVKVTIL
jgi:adhesin/invasin